MKRSLSKKTLNHPTVMQRQFFNYSLFPIPCSLFPVPYSLFPIPYSLLPIPYSLLPILPSIDYNFLGWLWQVF
ncbi:MULTISPECIES: hypothetical protein [unclassified Moorena]|uniref:hypothetical protein n=1 Tax=unclassified Moorena TaxID=2683338 RepID=UPI0013BB0C4E|nr:MULTISPECIES: hypothetical protein [unclassified Moorena]NEP32428.1 hypothetical protein [Moorena sp. SIO3B2]NEQ07319.1 hypothetical protein [Moorena sp. SIO4E2]